MPISAVILSCDPDRVEATRSALSARGSSELRSIVDNRLIVVTDTRSVEEDRAEVEALGALPGVVAAHVAFTNIEDIAEHAAARGDEQ